MSTLDVAAIRARCEAATPGEWWAETAVVHAPSWLPNAQPGAACHVAACRYGRNVLADAAFIAAARTDVPALLDALAQVEAENARLREALVESAAQLLFERRVRKEEHKPGGQRQQYWSDLHESRRDYWRVEARRQIAALGEAAPATREETTDGD